MGVFLVMGKPAKSASVAKVIGRMKKIHLRQHLRRIIKKCLKNPKICMDIPAFESWKCLGYGGIKDLGDFAKVVEIHDGHPEIMDIYSYNEIEAVTTRLRVKGPDTSIPKNPPTTKTEKVRNSNRKGKSSKNRRKEKE